MFGSKFAKDMENMLISLNNSGLQVAYMKFFLNDFDSFCKEKFPDTDVLTSDITENWIKNTTSKSKNHMTRRVRTMKHIGKYQLSLGKPAYIPNYTLRYEYSEEPHLFTDEQLVKFFDKVDAEVTTTKVFPYNDIVFPVMFRMIYCCGLRSSEACNLKMDNIDLIGGTLTIYRSKGFKDRKIFMSDDIRDLCLRFNEFYSEIIPDRIYFFQPSSSRECYTSYLIASCFDVVLKKASLYDVPGKKFTTHGLRHLFAVTNIKNCTKLGEDFANWIQYLCKYMGHKNIRCTMYYLHIISQLFPVYSEKLRLLEEGIGVMYAEE